MNKKRLLLFFVVLAALGGGVFYYFKTQRPPVETRFVPATREDSSTSTNEPSVSGTYKEPGESALIPNTHHTYQTFNNCGPATLSMILNWHGANVTQEELGGVMRPWQNADGDNDDKTIFTYEFVNWAKEYGFEALGRRNGDIELLKKFTANGIPVVVKTWLNVGEDIGHFRLVRGFDESRQIIVQDDSYHGPNRRVSYYDFLSMWQPFNYDYMVVYTPGMESTVKAILGEEWEEEKAWENALDRAEKEAGLDTENPYPIFNISTASYHLGDYERTVTEFEKVEGKLPRRMLWYQIEPILAYQKLENYNRVFEITNNILENGNRAFSELYLIKGEVYLAQGNTEAARREFEQALHYNENYTAAKDALDSF